MRTKGEAGFTLIELLIAMSLSVVLIGVVTDAFIVGLRTHDDVAVRLSESHDAQLLATLLPADLQSVSPSGVDTASGSVTGCAGSSPGTSVLKLSWTETVSGATTLFVADYRRETAGGETRLTRYFCSGATLATVTPLVTVAAHNLSPTVLPSVVVSGAQVSLQVTDATGYTYVIRGTRRTPAPTSSTTSTTANPNPVLTGAVMKDTNQNGKVDQVIATFSKPLTPTCASGWSSGGAVPSNGTLVPIATTVSGTDATLAITEGSGTADTSVGSFTINFAPIAGCSALAASGFVPSDGAAPVVIAITTTVPGTIVGQLQAGDALRVTFSESLVGAPAIATIVEDDGTGHNDTLSISGVSAGAVALGSKNYIGNGSTATFASSPISVSGSQLTVTVGPACAGNCSDLSSSSGVLAFTPAATLTDAAGLAAVSSFPTPSTFKAF